MTEKNQFGFQGPLRKYTELSQGTFVQAVEARIAGKLADDVVPCSLPVYKCFVYGSASNCTLVTLQKYTFSNYAYFFKEGDVFLHKNGVGEVQNDISSRVEYKTSSNSCSCAQYKVKQMKPPFL